MIISDRRVFQLQCKFFKSRDLGKHATALMEYLSRAAFQINKVQDQKKTERQIMVFIMLYSQDKRCGHRTLGYSRVSRDL